MRARSSLLSISVLAATLLAGPLACDDGGDSTVSASGDAFAFSLPGSPYGLIGGATISVLEHPEITTTTDSEGHFELEGLTPGESATFLMDAEGFPAASTKTFIVPEGGLTRVTFQIPDNDLYLAIAGGLGLTTDPETCQIVTTVTRVGKSLYDEGAHGEAGATVSSSPMIEAEIGPVYFNDEVLPTPSLTETSTDGGVLWANVPVGTYELSATKGGVEFESVTMECRAGVLVNASPPYGLQAL